MGKTAKICIAVLGGALVLVLIGLILTGLYVGWGPFTFLQFDKQEKAILKKYPGRPTTRRDRFLRGIQFPLMDGDGK